jgi:Cu(I)/Ag(I) efflux system membrane protein CusA/SilA
MIAHVITWSARNRGTVFILAAVLALWGAWSARQAPLDAIPDLSDTQVIVFTEWMGRSPDLVEDQVTWPLSSALLSTPQVKAVRGQSMFGMSFVYVLFEDGTVPEDARLGVTEILTRVGPRLPAGARPTLGPDATGVGWVYQYAVVDDSHALSSAELRQLQETVIKPALQATPGVAEIATVGGHVEQIEVSVDPARLLAHGATFEQVSAAVVRANVPAGGGSIEVAGHELMIRSRAEARSLDDLMDAPIPGARGAATSVAPRGVTGSTGAASTTDAMGAMGSPSSNAGVSTLVTASGGGGTHVVRVRDVADVQRAPAPRRGVADFDGLGETTGGIVVARQGGNALDVITGVKERLDGVQNALPPGVRIVPVYDRSTLIRGAVGTLAETLVEELVVVSLIIMLFLGHVRTALVPVLVLPIAVLAAFIPMAAQGITVNIMSLAGIAVAVGAMVDSAILTVENIHVHLAKWERDGRPGARIDALIAAMTEVGPSAFFSLLVIGVSFLPVFALEAAEGRLFGPLAWTKTWSMLFAAVLAVTLAPALAVTFITTRGKTEEEDWLSRVLTRLYAPVVRRLVRLRWLVVAAAAAFVAATVPVAASISWEFMPPMNEGSLLYMPGSPPGISEAEAARILQAMDAELRKVPEVAAVFGKMGRSDSATDPAPLTMAETVIELKPPEEWRPGLTWEGLVAELDARMTTPGLPNLWWYPVQTRTEMLSTGIRSPLGIKVQAPTLAAVEAGTTRLEKLLADVPGTRSVYADRSVGAFTLDVDMKRAEAAALGVSAGDIASTLEGGLAGQRAGDWIDGRLRLPIVVRYARDFRTDPDAIGDALVNGASGPVRLGLVADVVPRMGPDMIRSEDGQIVGYVFIDPGDRAVTDWVADAEVVLAEAGVSKEGLGNGAKFSWAGTFQSLERALGRLSWMIPLVVIAIAGLMRVNTGSWVATAIIVLSLPLSVCGAIWFLWLLDYNLSVAVIVGIIALAGVDAETGVVMLLYLGLAWDKRAADGALASRQDVEEAIIDGAARRLRPKLMTVATDVIGFIPVFVVGGLGSDVMRRIAAPMVGGLFASFAVELLVYPAVFAIWRGRSAWAQAGGTSPKGG